VVVDAALGTREGSTKFADSPYGVKFFCIESRENKPAVAGCAVDSGCGIADGTGAAEAGCAVGSGCGIADGTGAAEAGCAVGSGCGIADGTGAAEAGCAGGSGCGIADGTGAAEAGCAVNGRRGSLVGAVLKYVNVFRALKSGGKMCLKSCSSGISGLNSARCAVAAGSGSSWCCVAGSAFAATLWFANDLGALRLRGRFVFDGDFLVGDLAKTGFATRAPWLERNPDIIRVRRFTNLWKISLQRFSATSSCFGPAGSFRSHWL
jgi:hypothetical protein